MTKPDATVELTGDDLDRLLVRTNGVHFFRGHRYSPQCFENWYQLVYAAHGTLSVTTDQGVWVVPPQRAVLVPPGMTAGIELHGDVIMSSLYLDRDFATLPTDCRVFSVSPLLRELIRHIVGVGLLYAVNPAHVRLMQLVLDLLEELPVAGMKLAVPQDARLQRVMMLTQAQPDLCGSVVTIAEQIHCSRRTLERIALRDLGCSLGQWLRQIRMLAALRMLGGGHSVTRVADTLGYATPSAFIYAFRKLFAVSPSMYFQDTREG